MRAGMMENQPASFIMIAQTALVLIGNKKMTNLVDIKKEVLTQLKDKDTLNTLVATTFKGLVPANVPQAIMEGMMRGFSFKDFLEKNIYAVPYGSGYSLVTSIDYARKVGMRSGVCGKSAPVYEEADGKIVTCSVTIKRMVNETIGDYTAKVYFKEYYAGHKNPDGTIKKNKYGEMKPGLWDTKPYTMIAKVAEMHALRMACPEELSQAYVEEEKQAEVLIVKNEVEVAKAGVEASEYKEKLENAKTYEELGKVWSSIPVTAKEKYMELKNEMKAKFIPQKNENAKV